VPFPLVPRFEATGASELSEAHKSILTGGVGCGYFFVQAEMQVRILPRMRVWVAKWQGAEKARCRLFPGLSLRQFRIRNEL
jgi:hypothetical protein